MDIPCPVAGNKALEVMTDEVYPVENGRIQLEISAGGSAVFKIIQE